MDEGFTEFATHEVSAYYRETVTKKRMADNPAALRRMDSLSKILPLEQSGSYGSYYGLAKSGFEEPMTTHADHFNTNYAYGSASYSKGSVFLAQLGYIVGDQVRDKILLNYYWAWRYQASYCK